MVDASRNIGSALYVLTVLDWQREGITTRDTQQAQWLFQLAALFDYLEAQQATTDTLTTPQVILSNQAILLDDIARIDPALLPELLDHIRKGRLRIAPYYAEIESILASSEIHIRNFLLGHKLFKRYQLPLSSILFAPQVSYASAQLPQILSGFQIETAYIAFGQAIIPMPFIWEAPNKSRVFVISYQDYQRPEAAITTQQQLQPGSTPLWIQPFDMAIVPNSSISVKRGNLHDYTQALRTYLPETVRPRLKGGLNLQIDANNSGRLSAQLPLTQAVYQTAQRLIHIAEPLVALAQMHTRTRVQPMQIALIDYSWRLLLQNMSPTIASGAINDDSYAEIVLRNRRVRDTTKQVIEQAMTQLEGTPHHANIARSSVSESYLVVWNTHGHAVRQAVALQLDLPYNKHPNVLLNPDGQEIPFAWSVASNCLEFYADMPALSHAVYTLKISYDPTAAYNQLRPMANRTIGSTSDDSLTLDQKQLVWQSKNRRVDAMLRYIDGGDAGSVWQYQAPDPDILVTANLTDDVQVLTSPLYERLRYRSRMRIAPGLTNGKARTRGLKVLDIITTATVYNDHPGIYFTTQLTNTAQDHRLRMHLRSGLAPQQILTQHALSLPPCPLQQDDRAIHEQVTQSLIHLRDQGQYVSLFTRGGATFETVEEDAQRTVALTLLRSVQWIDQHKTIASKQSTLLRPHQYEVLLTAGDGAQTPLDLWQQALSYQSPLTVRQYAEKPAQARHQYLHFEGDHVLMTSLKPANDGRSIILRLFNTSDHRTQCKLHRNAAAQQVRRVSLAESHLMDVKCTERAFKIAMHAQELVSLQLAFN